MPHIPPWIVKCGCKTCSKLGALWAYYPDRAVMVTGQTEAYICNSRVIGIHHCPICGCVTHWRSLGQDFGRMAINARLIDNGEIPAIPVRVIDGPTPAVFGDSWPPD